LFGIAESDALIRTSTHHKQLIRFATDLREFEGNIQDPHGILFVTFLIPPCTISGVLL